MNLPIICGAAGTAEAAQPNTFLTFLPLILLMVVLYFFMLRPQQKREKELQQMRASLEVGDDVITGGGIIGTVVSIKEDTVVIETSGDRNKIRILRAAVQRRDTEEAKASK